MLSAAEMVLDAKPIDTSEYAKKITERTNEMKALDDELIYGTTLPMPSTNGWVVCGVTLEVYNKLKTRLINSGEIPYLYHSGDMAIAISIYNKGVMISIKNVIFARDIHYKITKRTDTDFTIQFI